MKKVHNRQPFNRKCKPNNSDKTKFTHKLFELAAKVVENTNERTVGFKNAFNLTPIEDKFMRPVYGIGARVMNNWKICDNILEKSGILKENPNADKNLLRVILVELLWGRRRVLGKGEIYNAVRSKKDLFVSLLKEHPTIKENVLKVFHARANTLMYTVDTCLSHLEGLGYSLIDTPSSYSGYLKAVERLEPGSFMIDFHFKDLFVFNVKAKGNLIKESIVKNNFIVIQSKSSLIPVRLMGVKPGNVVLDMCAAPGMKTALISGQLEGKGKVFAVDKNKFRYNVMIKNLKQLGAEKIVQFINCDVLFLKCKHETFDLILLDAPCSGSGMETRLGETDIDADRLSKLQWLQMKLLTNALTSFPNVKRVVYSTCSICPEENEAVVDQVLEKLNDKLTYKLVNCHEIIEGFSKGSEDYKCGSFCLKVSAERDFSGGFFVAAFDKDPSKVRPEDKSKNKEKAGVKRKHSEERNSENEEEEAIESEVEEELNESEEEEVGVIEKEVDEEEVTIKTKFEAEDSGNTNKQETSPQKRKGKLNRKLKKIVPPAKKLKSFRHESENTLQNERLHVRKESSKKKKRKKIILQNNELYNSLEGKITGEASKISPGKIKSKSDTTAPEQQSEKTPHRNNSQQIKLVQDLKRKQKRKRKKKGFNKINSKGTKDKRM